MTFSNKEKDLLDILYRSYYADELIDIIEVRDKNKWGSKEFEIMLDKLKHEYLINPVALRRYEITAEGIIHAEQEGIAPLELIQKNSKIRTVIIEKLYKSYEQEGPYGEVDFRGIASEAGENETDISLNMIVLRDLGYVESGSLGMFTITHTGIEAYKEYQERNALHQKFIEISNMAPQMRGRAFQTLLAEIIEQEGWHQKEGVRTTNEEMDIIVFRDREYYIVECKWEKAPIEANVIREFMGKLENRVGVRGIMVSMSGFTKGAINQAESYSNKRIILFFGSGDINLLVSGDISFEEQLNSKYEKMIMEKKISYN